MQKWFFLIVMLLGLSRASAEEQKRLYVAAPGLRNYVEWGGAGILVFAIDVSSRQIVARLVDEQNRRVQSEKVVEVDFDDGQPVQAGDQFGL
ncbi:MAG: hypothetical protein U0939_19665 [Pirellulales bacterium]